MARSQVNKSLLFFIVAAILAAQWTTRHVHFPTSHSHGDVEHKHVSVAHSHHSAIDLDSASEFSHQSAQFAVIDLGGDKTSVVTGQLGKSFLVARRLVFDAAPLFAGKIPPPDRFAALFGYLERSTVRLRAPPVSA